MLHPSLRDPIKQKCNLSYLKKINNNKHIFFVSVNVSKRTCMGCPGLKMTEGQIKVLDNDKTVQSLFCSFSRSQSEKQNVFT